VYPESIGDGRDKGTKDKTTGREQPLLALESAGREDLPAADGLLIPTVEQL